MTELPLAAASLRLRQRPGRPRKHSVQLAGPAAAAARPLRPAHKPEIAAPARLASIAPRLLNVRQAAQYLGLSTWTVRELEAAGTLHRVRLPVRKVLFDRSVLDRLIAAGYQISA